MDKDRLYGEAPDPVTRLTCTLASFSLAFGLFLCFADQYSPAIRRFSVQSVGLGALQVAALLLSWLLGALLGWIPVLGTLVRTVLAILVAAVLVLSVMLRVRMAFRAYRGETYLLPVIGKALTRFE